MTDLLSNCRRVCSFGVLKNNKLLARLSSFPFLGFMASLNTLGTTLNLRLLDSLLLDLCFLAFAHRGCSTNCLYHSSLNRHTRGRAHDEVTS